MGKRGFQPQTRIEKKRSIKYRYGGIFFIKKLLTFFNRYDIIVTVKEVLHYDNS